MYIYQTHTESWDRSKVGGNTNDLWKLLVKVNVHLRPKLLHCSWWEETEERVDEFHLSVTRFIVKDLQPFTTVVQQSDCTYELCYLIYLTGFMLFPSLNTHHVLNRSYLFKIVLFSDQQSVTVRETNICPFFWKCTFSQTKVRNLIEFVLIQR